MNARPILWAFTQKLKKPEKQFMKISMIAANGLKKMAIRRMKAITRSKSISPRSVLRTIYTTYALKIGAASLARNARAFSCL